MMPLPRYPGSLAAGALALAALAPFGQHSAHAQQIVLSNARSLDFGRFVAGTGGTVTVSPLGVRSRTGGVILLNSPNAGQAGFNVGKSDSGNGDKAIIISVPSNGSTRLDSGAHSMAVDSFVNNPASLVSVPVGGTPLSVGATLVVAPNQPAGTYTGSFALTVNFQ